MINNNINHYYEKHYDKENLLQKKIREYIQNDDNVSKFLAPINDGLMICIKI